MVERGVGDREVASGPGGPPYRTPVGCPQRTPPFRFHYHFRIFYRRRLPHLYRADQSIFLTGRLYGSLPPNRYFPAAGVSSGKAFAALDRLLDEACTGPFYLRRPAIADMLVEVIQHNADVLGRYTLHAFVVMPNHIHMLVSPSIPLPQLTKTLKGFTAKRANQMLARTGNPFWQEESYDHLVRDRAEWERILLPAGSYRLTTVVRDAGGNSVQYENAFEVN